MEKISLDRKALSGVRVLVVDDTEDSRRLASSVLSRCGAEVQEANCAAAALAQLEQKYPDVMVSDISMPGQDGCELLQEVRAREQAGQPHLPAAAMTGLLGESDKRRCYASGFERFIAKPIDFQQLITIVRDLASMRVEQAQV